MSSLISLKDIVDRFKTAKKVYIPLYQRNYKWDKEMAAKLAKDLLEAFKKDNTKDYNLGILTLYEKDEEIQIIDGQQRMITLSLIVKVLGEIKSDNRLNPLDNWFNLLFERDYGFDDSSEFSPRNDYIYSNGFEEDNENNKSKNNKSVDVSRKIENFESINGKIGEYPNVNKEDFFNYLLEHVKLLYRVTKSEPLDEFLNMNFHKTPFCAADHIKAYMILDADANKKEITITKIHELWKKLERVLFQIENCRGIENEMFSLIKKNYNEEILSMNRMEILFYDRYLDKDYSKNLDKYYDIDNALEVEYNRLSYYYDVMKSVLDEIAIIDKDGNRHPNFNALNAYNLLCKKKDDVRFFEIIGEEENIEGKKDVSEVLKKRFNLTEKSHEEIYSTEDLNSQNQFMEAMLSSKNNYEAEKKSENNFINTKDIAQMNYIKNENNFNKYKEIFDKSFNEYIELIEKGKNANSGIDKNLEDGKKVLYDLIGDPNIEKIVIPSIQRDYVMGSLEEYLKKYLQHISWTYLWSRYNEFEKCKIQGYKDDNYEELEKILFINNNSKKILKFGKIKPSSGDRRLKYNEYKSSLNKPPEVTDFRKYGEDSDYYRFCDRINKLVELRDIFIGDKIKICRESGIEFDKKFNTGFITGYLDEDKTFWVYDGQQRLVTSIVLLALTKTKEDKVFLRNLKKFSFEGRNGANSCLEILLDYDLKNEEKRKRMRKHIDDKSSYSIYKLVENYEDLKGDETIIINPAYLLEGMEFEFSVVDKIDDVEQLFIEMNEGLKLEPYEQYKAEFNHMVAKILSSKDAKDILRKIDNEWLNYYKTEEKEIKWLKYCVTMANYEINGYNSSLAYGSFQGMNKDIIELAEEALDKLVKNKIDVSNVNLVDISIESISLWVQIMTNDFKDKAENMSWDGKIYFEKDFKEFLETFLMFIPSEGEKENFYSKCFETIKEFRNSKCLVIPKAGEEENKEEETYRKMLENRKDQFEFREISKWEKYYKSVNDGSGYEYVEKNKDKSFALEQVKPKNNNFNYIIGEDMKIWEYIDKLEIKKIIALGEDIISKDTSNIKVAEALAKKIVLGNEDCRNRIYDDKNKKIKGEEVYYFYANKEWPINIEPIDSKDDNSQTDLGKLIIEAFKKGHPFLVTEVEVNEKILENCKVAKDIYDILRGTWYLNKDKKDFENDSMEITVNNIPIKVIDENEINYKVFKLWNVSISKYVDTTGELLYRYKYCDIKVKVYYEHFITWQYFYKAIYGECQEELYYIARKYLKDKKDIRDWYLDRYLEYQNRVSEDVKKNILPLFLDEDFDKNSNKDEYCKLRGF
ncbi:DUF262 domain-containing protein [Tissierella praeacuta]|jgi:hypothetical protein|uniref:DUF262 domain-containing protein n=1 Tax=Tissierella praeacuta TaxID=43131 RepID=UPI0028AC5676|nr:DUF262 domain-containing protein [Tissierella praeacuta]